MEKIAVDKTRSFIHNRLVIPHPVEGRMRVVCRGSSLLRCGAVMFVRWLSILGEVFSISGWAKTTLIGLP